MNIWLLFYALCAPIENFRTASLILSDFRSKFNNFYWTSFVFRIWWQQKYYNLIYWHDTRSCEFRFSGWSTTSGESVNYSSFLPGICQGIVYRVDSNIQLMSVGGGCRPHRQLREGNSMYWLLSERRRTPIIFVIVSMHVDAMK